MKEKGDPELRENLNVHASRKGIIEPSIVCLSTSGPSFRKYNASHYASFVNRT
jgi:hypothetical protein